jgi:hypothetical protein
LFVLVRKRNVWIEEYISRLCGIGGGGVKKKAGRELFERNALKGQN